MGRCHASPTISANSSGNVHRPVIVNVAINVLPTMMLRKRMGYTNRRDISNRSTICELYEAGNNSQRKKMPQLISIVNSYAAVGESIISTIARPVASARINGSEKTSETIRSKNSTARHRAPIR